ncbi:MAG: hypothetical protein JW934_02360 [Anaerolineae bacterium]|nr:hypothetical protein [Anaerolineae bacterium]
MSSGEKRVVQDIHFRLTAGSQGYTVEARGPGDSASRAAFELPLSDLEVENFLLRVGRPRRTFSRGRVAEPYRPTVEFGSKLFDALCGGPVREVLAAERRAAELGGYRLRLKLCLSSAPALTDLPWEFLYDSGSGAGFGAFDPDAAGALPGIAASVPAAAH